MGFGLVMAFLSLAALYIGGSGLEMVSGSAFWDAGREEEKGAVSGRTREGTV